MKIRKIETFPIKLQLKEPFVIASVVNHDMFYVIVKLTTDNNIIGYGEAIPAWEVTGETQFSVIDVINHLCEPNKSSLNLIGEDISTYKKVSSLIEKISSKNQPAPIWGAPSAKAAIEEAILDAYGKFIEKPVYELFNGKNRPVPFNKVISIYPIEETLEKVKQELEKGVEIIKLKVGIKKIGDIDNYERDMQVIKEAKELIKAKPEVKLVADANQGYIDADTTISILKQVEGCLDWLEQPVLADDKLAFKKIKEACDIKLMADESIHNYHDAELLLELGAVDYLNLKLMKTGGMISALGIADLAKKYNVKCQLGSMIENQIGTVICLHTFLSHDNFMGTELDSFLRLRQCIGKGVTTKESHLNIPDKPGIGLEVNDQEIIENLITEQDSITFKQTRNGFKNDKKHA